MPPKRKGYLLTLGILVLVIIISVLTFSIPYNDPLLLVVRLFALYGFLFLSVATIMTPFLKEITKLFGKPFIKIHHIFAVFGLVSATLHPVMYSIQAQNILVFLPSFALGTIFGALLDEKHSPLSMWR
jgi:sulfoxide reductase heme-binding subunit YedZ